MWWQLQEYRPHKGDGVTWRESDSPCEGHRPTRLQPSQLRGMVVPRLEQPHELRHRPIRRDLPVVLSHLREACEQLRRRVRDLSIRQLQQRDQRRQHSVRDEGRQARPDGREHRKQLRRDMGDGRTFTQVRA